jgi:hypothetical protein
VRDDWIRLCIPSFLRAWVLSPCSFLILLQELEMTPEQFEVLLHPVDNEEDQQNGMEAGIEANYMPPSNLEEEGEEWFWVWA